jgi:hypothetical protein
MGRITSGGVIFALLISTYCTAARAEESLNPIIDDVADYWSPVIDDPAVGEPIDISAGVLEEIIPAQMLTPQRQPSLRVAQNRRRRRTAATSTSGLASVPFMIGDTGAGTCLAFTGLLDVELSHPTLTCSRLNISENNSALPSDRLYFSYRHFHNATPTRVYQFSQDFNIDRFTLGGEKTFFGDLFSFEVRLPLEGRLNSDTITRLRALDAPPVFSPLAGGDFFEGRGLRSTELGNIAMIFKALLYERNDCAISAGVAFTLPTAKDVNYQADIYNSFTFADPALTADQDILLHLTASNETVYIAPYMAWLIAPEQKRWYHQGFLQVEVAANDSTIQAVGNGSSDFYVNNVFQQTDVWAISFPGRAPLAAQTLLRLNLGLGYVLMENPCNTWVQKLTALFETHYTTTLNDANLWSIPVIADPGNGFGSQNLTFGNLENRVDVFNVVAGLTMDVGNYVVTNGFTMPVTTGSNRGFDFEYNLQIQRPF